MIVKMKKVFIVTTASLSDAALDALGELGVIHVEPVDPSASPPEQIKSRHSRIHQAMLIPNPLLMKSSKSSIGFAKTATAWQSCIVKQKNLPSGATCDESNSMPYQPLA